MVLLSWQSLVFDLLEKSERARLSRVTAGSVSTYHQSIAVTEMLLVY